MKVASAIATVALLAIAPQPAQGAFVGISVIAASLAGIIGRVLGSAIQGRPKGIIGSGYAAAMPPGVPEFEYDRCRNDIRGRTIEINTNHVNYLEIKGLPATCMNLANVMVGDGTSGPYALPCGSDCLFYNSINASQRNSRTRFACRPCNMLFLFEPTEF